MEWLQSYIQITLNILAPGIYDHALLHLDSHDQNNTRRRSKFKFFNNVTELDGYHTELNSGRRIHVAGRPMHVLWKKQIRV